MSLFSRNRPAAQPATTRNAAATDSTAPTTDQVLDMLAGLLRTYGARGFDIDSMKASELRQRCESWALHLLTGAPAPLGDDWPEERGTAEAVTLDQRRWADMQQFFRMHRHDEQVSVQSRVEGMRSLIGELTCGLRAAITDDSSRDEHVTEELSALGKAVESNSLAAIRAQLARTVDCVSQAIHQRNARYEAQLQSLSERVHSLRNDLVLMREKASLDALTQVHNRGAFDEVLSSQIDFSFLSGQTMALMMLDLDHFKEINDSHGHPAGDLVLQAVANTLVRVFPRRSDFVARYGGEEFAVILVDIEPGDLEALCRRVLACVRDLQVSYNSNTLQLTCSIGIAVCTRQDTAQTLLYRADQSLYRAKRGGRNRAELDTDPTGIDMP